MTRWIYTNFELSFAGYRQNAIRKVVLLLEGYKVCTTILGIQG